MESPSKTSRLIISLLDERDMTQSSLSAATNVSIAYTNHVVHGRRLPSAQWLDLVSETLKLNDRTRKDLHRSAAEDMAKKYGYDVDL